jgi:purine-binding chemotaxis protein CheW
MTTLPKAAAPRAVDWAAVRRQMAAAIEQTEALLESAERDTAADDARRSPFPGRDPSAEEERKRLASMVLFVLSGCRFAIDIRYVCEIVSKPRTTPLPSMPGYVFGVHDLRGQLLPVFNLGVLLDLQAEVTTTVDWAIVCGDTQPEFLILAEAMPEVTELPPEEMVPGGNAAYWSCASTGDGSAVLDGALLLNDRRFFLESEQITDIDGEG